MGTYDGSYNVITRYLYSALKSAKKIVKSLFTKNLQFDETLQHYLPQIFSNGAIRKELGVKKKFQF